jgi:glycosyltransferase involved in cell wall biosynthesis
LRAHPDEIDLVHAWPLASLETIQVAKRLGIPVMLERINAHIRFAFEIVTEECGLVGVELPPGHDHELNLDSLAREEREYAEADYLLCPSEFVAHSFLELGCAENKILRHHYGFDENRFSPADHSTSRSQGLTMIYAGVCEPRKGLHYALEAWLASGAQEHGKFRICGAFVPGYAERIAHLLSHPSVEVLGHRSDLPDLMRQSDVFILPSVEEGSALVTYEARGSGCVLVVSENAGAVCRHQQDGLIHPIRDVATLTGHIATLDREPQTLARMRQASLDTTEEITWTAAGRRLAEVYRSVAPEMTRKRRAKAGDPR